MQELVACALTSQSSLLDVRLRSLPLGLHVGFPGAWDRDKF